MLVSRKDAVNVIPRNALNLGDLKVQYWTNQIGNKLFEVLDLDPNAAKVRFLRKSLKFLSAEFACLEKSCCVH